MSSESQTAVSFDLIPSAMRRLDVEAKQLIVSKLLQDTAAEGLLVTGQANFAWLTGGAEPPPGSAADDHPALYFNSSQRWLVCNSTDTQWYFDRQLDELGFQLKEWHWTSSREHLLADLVFARKVVGDTPFREVRDTSAFFVQERRRLTPQESQRLAETAAVTARAVEATGRTLNLGDTESEIAGQLAHRMLRHGVTPVMIQIDADGNNDRHPRRLPTDSPVRSTCRLSAIGRRGGLHAAVARLVAFGTPDDSLRTAYDSALRWSAVHQSAVRPGEKIQSALDAGRTTLRTTPFEHEHRTLAPTALIGYSDGIESAFPGPGADRWQIGWGVVWQERVGSVGLSDTYRITELGSELLTVPTEWPIRKAVLQGRSYERADILIRDS